MPRVGAPLCTGPAICTIDNIEKKRETGEEQMNTDVGEKAMP